MFFFKVKLARFKGISGNVVDFKKINKTVHLMTLQKSKCIYNEHLEPYKVGPSEAKLQWHVSIVYQRINESGFMGFFLTSKQV